MSFHTSNIPCLRCFLFARRLSAYILGHHPVIVGVQAFVGVAVGGGVAAVCGVAVLVGKPVPADAGAAFQQFDDEVLVEVAAVFLGFDDPTFTAFVGKSRVFAFAVKLADEEGFARPALPLLHCHASGCHLW